jgi:hypothetical protein
MAGESGGGHGATTAVWIATAVIMVGVVVGGIALIEWVWPVFWIGVGLMVAGVAAGYFSHIMDMVSEYTPAASHQEIEPG